MREVNRQFESRFMMQIDYLAEPKRRITAADVSDEIIAKLPDKLAAIRLCIQASGLEPKRICAVLGRHVGDGDSPMDQGHLSRILAGDANFPTNAENDLMDACGNEIPLRWAAWTRGQELRRRLSAVEQENEELKAALRDRDTQIDTIKRFFRETRT